MNLKKELISLGDSIIGNLTFFDKYYWYAVKWGEQVYYKKDFLRDELKPISFNDNDGNYFYFRINGQIRSEQINARGCTYDSRFYIPVRMVAHFKRLDLFKVADALVNELLKDSATLLRNLEIDGQIIAQNELDLEQLGQADSWIKIMQGNVLALDFDLIKIVSANLKYPSADCPLDLCLDPDCS